MFRYLSRKQHALHLFLPPTIGMFVRKSLVFYNNKMRRQWKGIPKMPFNLRKKHFLTLLLSYTISSYNIKTFMEWERVKSWKGKQGSMIIKLRKDKKIVNDMFKQAISREVVRLKGEWRRRHNNKPSCEWKWINESINNRIALSLQSDNKVLVLTEKFWTNIFFRHFPSQEKHKLFKEEKLMNI